MCIRDRVGNALDLPGLVRGENSDDEVVHGAVLLLWNGQYRQLICEQTVAWRFIPLPVGAKLARDEINSILLEPRCLYREQALLPQDDISGIVYKP